MKSDKGIKKQEQKEFNQEIGLYLHETQINPQQRKKTLRTDSLKEQTLYSFKHTIENKTEVYLMDEEQIRTLYAYEMILMDMNKNTSVFLKKDKHVLDLSRTGRDFLQETFKIVMEEIETRTGNKLYHLGTQQKSLDEHINEITTKNENIHIDDGIDVGALKIRKQSYKIVTMPEQQGSIPTWGYENLGFQ